MLPAAARSRRRCSAGSGTAADARELWGDYHQSDRLFLGEVVGYEIVAARHPDSQSNLEVLRVLPEQRLESEHRYLGRLPLLMYPLAVPVPNDGSNDEEPSL